MDIWTKTKRSQVMSAVRSRGNKSTEHSLAVALRRERVRGWRRHRRISLGTGFSVRPDFVFPAHRLAVFVDGCFWHGCPLHATQPKQNAKFWREKIAQNQTRDALVTRTLRRAGWRVLRVWEHELTRRYERRLLARLRRAGLLSSAQD